MTLQYYMHDGPSAFRFEIAGDLDSDGARRLEQDWRTAFTTIGNRLLIVDMTFVTSLNKDAKALIARWHRSGAQIVAKSRLATELAEAAIGHPLDMARRVTQPERHDTWAPFSTSLSMFRRLFGRVDGPTDRRSS